MRKFAFLLAVLLLPVSGSLNSAPSKQLLLNANIQEMADRLKDMALTGNELHFVWQSIGGSISDIVDQVGKLVVEGGGIGEWVLLLAPGFALLRRRPYRSRSGRRLRPPKGHRSGRGGALALTQSVLPLSRRDYCSRRVLYQSAPASASLAAR